ncbi:MAG: hypothetical protein WAM91_17480 [Candidatus Acidiferrales bacterium]
MSEVVTIEWSYTPVDFFEEPFEHSEDNYLAKFENGRVVTTLSNGAGGQAEILCPQIEAELDRMFLGAQQINNRKYQFSGHTIVRTRPGERNAEISVSMNADMYVTTDPVDVLTRDAAGNVTCDTKGERIKAQSDSAHRAVKHGKDPTLAALLKSYNAAMSDSQNEFVHLYEIRDALGKKFGGESQALTSLGIDKKPWNKLGKLANDAPLKQGRHRGRTAAQLRGATEEELKEGRQIAKAMIRAYQDYLERNG